MCGVCWAVLCVGGHAGQAWIENVRYFPVEFSGAATRSVVVCPKSGEAPTVDGKLDEAVWMRALTIQDFYQLSEGGRGAPATVKTRVYLTYDDKALYVAAVCSDAKTMELETPYHLKQVDFYNSIELFLDTNADAKSYYQVVLDWKERVWSAYYQAEGQADQSWESHAEVRVTRAPDAWTLEAALPLEDFPNVKTLDSQTWGINIGRNQRTIQSEINTSWCGVYHGPAQYQRVAFAAAGRVVPSELSMGEGVLGHNTVRGSIVNPAAQPVAVNAVLELLVGDRKWEALPGSQAIQVPAGGEAGFELDYDVPQAWTPAHADEPKKLMRVAFRDAESGRHMGGSSAWIITPSVLTMRTDRVRYHFHDLRGQGVVNINVSRDLLPRSKLRLALRPEEGGSPVRESTLAELADREVVFYMALEDVEPGAYLLKVDLTVDGKEIAGLEAPLRKAPGQSGEVKRARVPVIVQPLEAPDGIWPITTGVPFPNGVLRDGDRVRMLGPDGKETPIQVQTTARWSPDGFVRWLLLDFPAKVNPSGPATYQLEYGSAVRREPVASPLKVEEDSGAVTITTGPLRFAVGKDRFRFLKSAWLDTNGDGRFDDAEQVIVPGDGAGAYLVDHTGTRYASGNVAPDIVELEERGPQRAVIRAEGWQTTPDGERLGRYVTRIHAYAGQPFLRVFHTFIITADSRKVRYRDIALETPLADMRRGLVGLGDGKTYESEGAFSFVQDAWNHGFVHGEEAPTEASQGEGWIRADGRRAGLTVCVRDFWQNYPKELELVPPAAPPSTLNLRPSTLRIHFWPAHNTPRKHTLADTGLSNLHMLYFAHEGKELDFQIPPDYQTKFNKDNECYYVESATECANAIGLGKTHEMLYLFHPADASPASVQTACAAFQQGGACLAAPEWVCASGAMDGSMPMHPHDPERFPEIEWALSAMFDWERRTQEYTHDYGMWVFGDAHDTWLPETKCWRVHRTWINTHHGSPRVPWLLYARSGDPKYLTYARQKAYRCMDLGFCHYSTPAFEGLAYPGQKIKGALTDYKGLVPWNAGGRLFDYNCMTDFLLYNFYLTGDRRALDVMQEWLDAAVERFQRPSAHRTGSGVLASALMAYQHTWDYRLLEIIDKYVNAKLASQREDGEIPGWSEYAPWLSRLHRFTGRRDAEQCLEKWCENRVRRMEDNARPYRQHFWAVTYGYHVFGRERYLASQTGAMRVTLDRIYRVPGDFYDGFHSPSTSYWNGYLSQEIPFYLHALVQHGKPVAPVYARCQVFDIRKGAYRFIALDEDDRAIRFSSTVTTPETRFTLTAPNGKVIREGTIQNTKSEEFEVNVPSDGQKGEYVLAMEVASYASLRYPMSDLPKEVFDTGYQRVTPVYGHRLCFFVPDEAGACRLDVERTAQPRGFCLYDGNEQAALRLYWTDTQRRIVPVEFQPPADQRGRVWAVNVGQKTKRTSFALHKPLLPYISLRREQFLVPSPTK